MAFGLEIFNQSGSTSLSSEVLPMRVKSTGSVIVEFYSGNNTYGIARVPTPLNANELLALQIPNYTKLSTAMEFGELGMFAYDSRGSQYSPIGRTVNWAILDSVPNGSNKSYGFEIYGSDGTLYFSSHNQQMTINTVKNWVIDYAGSYPPETVPLGVNQYVICPSFTHTTAGYMQYFIRDADVSNITVYQSIVWGDVTGTLPNPVSMWALIGDIV